MTKNERPEPRAVDDAAILAAAARLFREKGFERTTLREVARAAGILPGSLHYRYPAKEELLLELMRRAVSLLTASVRAAIDECRDPVERIRQALRAHLRLLLSGDDMVFTLLFEWRSLRGPARAEMVRLRDQYEALWEGLLYAAAGTGRVRAGVDLQLLRLLGFGAVNWVATWYAPGGRMSHEQIADAFWAYLGLGVLKPSAERGAA
ncbi:MAG TPA: TetR/AcrR family transcriptional regulator [Anaeromyxobacteraceae bacterium]|nr:TetR/AcrR family transcriptional regulator [Anaeromyxobacteraceae bacterium]